LLRIVPQQLKANVVGDCVTLKTREQTLLKRAFCVDNEGLAVHPHEKVRAEFALGGKEQSRKRLAGLKCPKVVAQLAVQIAKAIRTGDADARAGSQEEKPAMAAKMTQTTRP
jgi:hypothetical protein